MFSRTKSVGRLARSVEIITQRPTIGSFLSSGNSLNPFYTTTQTSHLTPERHSRILRSAGGDYNRHSIRSRYRISIGTLAEAAASTPEPHGRFPDACVDRPPIPRFLRHVTFEF